MSVLFNNTLNQKNLLDHLESNIIEIDEHTIYVPNEGQSNFIIY